MSAASPTHPLPLGDATTEQPALLSLPANGLQLAAWEWRAERRGQGPTLLLVHATGFHGRVWDQVVRRLPGRHVIAIDQRGHGRSRAASFNTWDDFARDLACAAEHLGLHQAVGVGHSMGGVALLQAASFLPQAFARLMLVDPVLFEPAQYLAHPVPPLQLHPAAGRKNRFDSAQAMFDRFADRLPYAVFDRAALMDYCQHALRPADDGAGLQLACDPAFEGRVYPMARQNPSVIASVRALQIPVQVLRARPQDPSMLPWDPLGSPTWPGAAAEFHHGSDLQLPDKTHFLPMEDPALVAGLIARQLA